MSHVTLSGDLPSGPTFTAYVSLQVIAIRAGDRICVAHERWMTADRAAQVADALLAVSDGAVRND